MSKVRKFNFQTRWAQLPVLVVTAGAVAFLPLLLCHCGQDTTRQNDINFSWLIFIFIHQRKIRLLIYARHLKRAPHCHLFLLFHVTNVLLKAGNQITLTAGVAITSLLAHRGPAGPQCDMNCQVGSTEIMDFLICGATLCHRRKSNNERHLRGIRTLDGRISLTILFIWNILCRNDWLVRWIILLPEWFCDIRP